MGRFITASCLGLLVVCSGCDQASSPPKGKTQKPQPPQTRQSKATEEMPQQEKATKETPLERFKKFVAKMEKELPKKHDELKGSDVEFKYDVRKTDSLVSPLTGVLALRWTVKSSDGVPDEKWLARCDYAYQDDQWIFKGVHVEITNFRDNPLYELESGRRLMEIVINQRQRQFRETLQASPKF